MRENQQEQQLTSGEVRRNESNAYVSKTLNNSPFGLLPSEILYQIFAHLTLHELYALKQVCRLWQQTIQGFPEINSARTYEVILKGSQLWRYLPAIINDNPLLAFIQERLSPFPIPEYQQENFTTLTAFCNQVRERLITDKDLLPYQKKMTAEYFVQQAQFILNYIEQFGQPKAKKLEEWFAFKWQHHQFQLIVMQAYLGLENVLSTMSFIIRTSHLKQPMSNVSEICNLRTDYWPTGEDLVSLEIYIFLLLYNILGQSINLHISLQEIQSLSTEQFIDQARQEQYQQRLISLDTLLTRLKYTDWLQFLELDAMDYSFRPRARMLSRALKMNHPAIPTQLAQPISLILESTKDREPYGWWPKRKEKRDEIVSSYFNADDEPSIIEKKHNYRSTLLSSPEGLKKYNDFLRKRITRS